MKQYFGSQTEHAQENFPFTYPIVHTELVSSIAEIKEAAAQANKQAGDLPSTIADAIVQASKEVSLGLFNDQFILSGLQGGAGTSINMNVNEVIASRAGEILQEKNDEQPIHPNDHVNKSQSTNDVNPSALKIASIRLLTQILVVIDQFTDAMEKKAEEFTGINKLGRTHLQDAVPTTLSEEFRSYIAVIERDRQRMSEAIPYLFELNLGGTAIGNCVNASPAYIDAVYKELCAITKLQVKPVNNFMSQTSSQSDFVMVSHALVTLTLDLSKIASDIRLLSSGPKGGFGELILKEHQSGSSIMPGKVNPVLPETVNQLYFLVSGNNSTIEQAAQASQLELGVMFPILADRLLSSLKMTHEVLHQFSVQCIPSIQANKEMCVSHLEMSSAYATFLSPLLGYEMVSGIVKEALKDHKTIRQIVLDKKLLSEQQLDAALGTNKNTNINKEEGE